MAPKRKSQNLPKNAKQVKKGYHMQLNYSPSSKEEDSRTEGNKIIGKYKSNNNEEQKALSRVKMETLSP